MDRNLFVSKKLRYITIALALFDLLLIYALRPAWAGIGDVTGLPELAYILVAVSFILFLLSVISMFIRPRAVLIWVVFGFAALLCPAYLYVFKEDLADWNYILREFFIGLVFFGVLTAILLAVFRLGTTELSRKLWFRISLASVLMLAALLVIFDLSPNAILRGPVVYAVGEDYQIIYTTRARSTAWVNIGTESYYDAYAGYDRSETRVHKITVPMSILDAAGTYTVNSRSMILRGPYWALQGRTLSETRSWRPIDESDGIQYYCISDNHGFVKPSVEAARYYGSKLDFLIINGDTMSFLDRRSDLEMPLKLGYGVTKGERPVIYARGNHETKGLVSDELYRYVGADGEDYFYDFRLGSLWGLVLDLGEDHEDDWYEYYGTARFNEYRNRQTRFMDELISDSSASYKAEGVKYRLCVSHIAVNFKYPDDHQSNLLDEWTRRLNLMGIDLSLHGHRHALQYLSLDLPSEQPLRQNVAYNSKTDMEKIDGFRTAGNFPSFIGGRRSDAEHLMSQDDLFGRKMIGLAIETLGDTISVRFTDAEHETAHSIGAWTGEELGEVIKIKTSGAR